MIGPIIRNPGAVYRSTDSGHLTIVEANQTAIRETADAASALAERLVPGSTAWGTAYESGDFRMSGVRVTGRSIEVPVGLRWDTKAKGGARILVPAKRTEEGKAIAAEMEQVRQPLTSLGEVSEIVMITDGKNKYFSSAVIEVIDGQVYAAYHFPLCDEATGFRPSDRATVEQDSGWEPIALSEFYAARERAGTTVDA